MKRLGVALVLFICIVSLFFPAMAANSARQVNANATVDADGSCHVTLQLRLELDSDESLQYPLPGTARDILVNGQPVPTRKDGDRIFLTLPVSAPGQLLLTLEYTLDHAVNTQKELLTLPLLSGFSLPISEMEFSVTLPGEITQEPVFTSGYHQQQIGRQIETQVDGNTLHGRVTTALKDHETLQLELPVEAGWFTAAASGMRLPDNWVLAILGCILLAAIYFLLTLVPWMPRYSRCCSPPEGITAGEVGTCLSGCGTDLTLLVITWAQLGYLSLEPDTRGRVLLHKRMQMGNERSGAENRWFQQLFGSKTTIDGTGYHYAQLYRKVATKAPLLPMLFSPRSGSSRIFRAICCLAGIFSGIRMGLSMDMGLGGRTIMSLLLAGLAAVLSYLIQSGGKCLPLRNKTPLWTALGCGAAWIALGMLTGFTAMAIAMVLFQFAAGMCAAYGGKRSELGKRSLAQLLGLRSHMVGAKTFDLQQLMQKNPNYFYELAPYALAMGIDRKFARHFGKEPLPEDSFLNLGQHKAMTAAQWAAQLRRIADVLNKRQKRLPYEWLIGK